MDEDVRAALCRDPEMDRLVTEWGPVTVEPADDEYRRLAVSIINQQLSTASADAVRERVFTLLDDEVTPTAVLEADETALGEAGLSSAKIDYLRSTATAFQERDLTRAGLADHDDQAVMDQLTEIRGVGDWTARMYLIFVLGREDVLPLGDLAVRRGFEQVYSNEGDLSREEMREIADVWRPYRSYGTRYLWLAYENGDG